MVSYVDLYLPTARQHVTCWRATATSQRVMRRSIWNAYQALGMEAYLEGPGVYHGDKGG